MSTTTFGGHNHWHLKVGVQVDVVCPGCLGLVVTRCNCVPKGGEGGGCNGCGYRGSCDRALHSRADLWASGASSGHLEHIVGSGASCGHLELEVMSTATGRHNHGHCLGDVLVTSRTPRGSRAGGGS
jgi:hypothetical protein